METWTVRPGQAIGPIELGMTRNEVRAAMGEDGERGRSDAEIWFAGKTLRADFDVDDRVEFIEAPSDAPLRLGELEPFALDRDDLVTRAAEMLGETGEVKEGGETVQFDVHGVVFWGYNQHTATERKFEAIAVYGPGYYDR
jgi:hypothetical protein